MVEDEVLAEEIIQKDLQHADGDLRDETVDPEEPLVKAEVVQDGESDDGHQSGQNPADGEAGAM